MPVGDIRKRRNIYAVLLAFSILLTVLFALKPVFLTAMVYGGASIVLLMLLNRQNRLLYDASLICDNKILTVPSAVITIAGKEERKAEETVVSTFGLLMGSRICKWGCDGLHGVRLRAIEIDRERICLTFGDEAETMRVELLHGLTDVQAAIDVQQRMWRETGVKAGISGWQRITAENQ